MALNFQFAYFGSQHNYLARVMRISPDGIPQEDCFTESYGLPDAFASQFTKKSYTKRFLFNIRGHDFLSYSGQFKNKNGAGHLENSLVPISESSLLWSLKDDNQTREHDGVNMITSYGPKPGSLFVDAFSLKRYKWANLPAGLEDEIQKSICVKGYGDGEIYEVAINANGGWVLLLDKGKRFAFGGHLPFNLRIALQEAQKSKAEKSKLDASIYRIYLNHQHPQEYILLFKDGRCFVSLHAKFRDPLEKLLTIWATGNGLKKFSFNFQPSCSCSEYCQKGLNASYYSRRGLFFLSRLNPDLALKYLREASHQDGNNMQIRDNLAMALIAMRRRRGEDQCLDDRISNRPARAARHRPPPRSLEHQDADTLFRDEYMWMLDEDVDILELERNLDGIQKRFLATHGRYDVDGTLNEWSYDKAVDGGGAHEIGNSGRIGYVDPTVPGAIEMEAGVVVDRTASHEMPSVTEVPSNRDIVPDIKSVEVPNGVRVGKRYKIPFGKFKKGKE